MTELTFDIDADAVRTYSDGYLAFAWSAAQHNPARYGDVDAGRLVKAIGTEIIRRWLSAIEPELHSHKPESNYWSWLTVFARYEPPPGIRPVPGQDNAEWHRGRWVARTPEEFAEAMAARERAGQHPATAVTDEPAAETDG